MCVCLFVCLFVCLLLFVFVCVCACFFVGWLVGVFVCLLFCFFFSCCLFLFVCVVCLFVCIATHRWTAKTVLLRWENHWKFGVAHGSLAGSGSCPSPAAGSARRVFSSALRARAN